MAEAERHLPAGTRVRLRRPHNAMGWRGTATMLDPFTGQAIKDGRSDSFGRVEACSWQWARMRDQMPRPEHVGPLAGRFSDGEDAAHG